MTVGHQTDLVVTTKSDRWDATQPSPAMPQHISSLKAPVVEAVGGVAGATLGTVWVTVWL